MYQRWMGWGLCKEACKLYLHGQQVAKRTAWGFSLFKYYLLKGRERGCKPFIVEISHKGISNPSALERQTEIKKYSSMYFLCVRSVQASKNRGWNRALQGKWDRKTSFSSFGGNPINQCSCRTSDEESCQFVAVSSGKFLLKNEQITPLLSLITWSNICSVMEHYTSVSGRTLQTDRISIIGGQDDT